MMNARCMQGTVADNQFAFQSAQSFQEEFTQQDVGMTVSWNNSNFTCSPEGVQRLAETESETLMEVVRAQWPYIALAGGACCVIYAPPSDVPASVLQWNLFSTYCIM